MQLFKLEFWANVFAHAHKDIYMYFTNDPLPNERVVDWTTLYPMVQWYELVSNGGWYDIWKLLSICNRVHAGLCAQWPNNIMYMYLTRYLWGLSWPKLPNDLRRVHAGLYTVTQWPQFYSKNIRSKLAPIAQWPLGLYWSWWPITRSIIQLAHIAQ